jgi:hypothetical protein
VATSLGISGGMRRSLELMLFALFGAFFTFVLFSMPKVRPTSRSHPWGLAQY